MRLVILQPFYLPYLGVFELIRLADTFVVYDDVQFAPQNWQCRNRVKSAAGPVWLTVPVRRPHKVPIHTVELVPGQDWGKKHWRTIEMSYARAPHLDSLEQHLKPLLEERWERLVDVNLATLTCLAELVGVSTTFVRSSELGVPGRSSERVLRHCSELGATSYLSGPSARDYLDEPAFAEHGVSLEYLDFTHPTYPQLHGEFVPYLSVVDLLANVGPGSGQVLAGSGRPVPAREFEAST